MKHTRILALSLLAGVIASACAQLEDNYGDRDWAPRENRTSTDASGGNTAAVEAVADNSAVIVIDGDGAEATVDTGSQARANESNKADYRTTKQAIPTGKESTSALLLTKSMPREVQKNAEFQYTLLVENLTKDALDNVFVEDRLPNSLHAVDTDPKAMSNQGGKLLWNMGTLGAGETREISIRAVAVEDGNWESFSLASYDKVLKGEVRVVSPNLALTMTGPETAGPGDDVQLKVNVANNGTGTARNVNVAVNLPAGLEGPNGDKSLVANVGDLGAGQTRTVALRAKAVSTGEFAPAAEASFQGGSAVKASAAAIRVEDTRIEILADGPSKFFLGSPGKIEYTVKNVGQTVAKDVKVSQPMPKGMEMVRSSIPAEMADGVATWNLGDLAAGESKSMTVHLMPSETGSMELLAMAKASKGAQVQASLTAALEGLAALHFAVEDLQDPVPVGESVTYNVKVHNQGTAAGNHIAVEITLDEGMQLVRAAGPTNGRAEGNKIVFSALDTLEPDATATWRLVIQSSQAGDRRLKASLTSDRLQRPVVVTESTQYYE
ncbi:MAG: hypothetical protein R3F33_10715 [Planctomycetota bacterium]